MIPYYFAQSNCGKVRFIAAPFGYGPRIAAETMAKILNLTISEWQINTYSSHGKKYKVTLNFGVAQPVYEQESSFKVWIDCLMWLRRNIPQEVSDYDLFLAETFFKTNPILYSSELKSKIIDIAPLYSLNEHSSILDPKNEQKLEGHILVSFGGIETPFTKDIHRYAIPNIVLESLIIASQKFNEKRKIICCLPTHVSRQLDKNPIFSEIHFISPNHEGLISLLKAASIYIVQPGLYGPFEAFENSIPTVFTTPFSYTQVCQARAYEKENLLGHIPMWSVLNNEIGRLNGDIENEEEYCFEKIAYCFGKKVNNNFSNIYFDWAETVLKNKIDSINMINDRKQYVTKCKLKENHYLHSILNILL